MESINMQCRKNSNSAFNKISNLLDNRTLYLFLVFVFRFDFLIEKNKTRGPQRAYRRCGFEIFLIAVFGFGVG